MQMPLKWSLVSATHFPHALALLLYKHSFELAKSSSPSPHHEQLYCLNLQPLPMKAVGSSKIDQQ